MICVCCLGMTYSKRRAIALVFATGACFALTGGCERTTSNQAAARAAAQSDSVSKRALTDSTRTATPAAHSSARAGRSGPRTVLDSMGVRVAADARGRPVEAVGDFFGEHHDTPIDSFELVTIGTRRVADIPDEQEPCKQSDYWQPYSRVIVFADSAVTEWKWFLRRCLARFPIWPRMVHAYGGSGRVRRVGDTVTFYFAGNPTAKPYDRYRGVLTRDSLLPLVPSDTARRFVRLNHRAPPRRRKVPSGLAVVGDTFDLISVGARVLGARASSVECDLSAGPASERLLVQRGGRYVRQWVDKPQCRRQKATGAAAVVSHRATGTYRTHHDTLTFLESDGSRLLEWLPAVLSADSLREIRAVPGLERQYARHPHHQPPIKSPMPALGAKLLRKLNPAITGAEIALIGPPNPQSGRRAVYLHGVRSDSTWHGNPRDDLFVIVQADSSLTRIDRVIAVVPSPKWRDFGLDPAFGNKDSVMFSGWTLRMGERAARPLDRSPEWRWADLPGWTPIVYPHADNTLVQWGMTKWFKW